MNSTHKNNIEIALFMGATVNGKFFTDTKEIDHFSLDMDKNRQQNQRYWASNTLKYHKEWDWLMPVIEKIEKEYEVAIIGNECDITHMGYQSWSFITEKAGTKIKAVYNAVITYLEMLKIKIKQPTK